MNARPAGALALALAAIGGPSWPAVREPCLDGSANPGATAFVGVREDVARSVGVPEPSMDIVSADLVSDRRQITVTIRLADLSSPGPMALAGARYTFLFFPPGKTWASLEPGMALVADVMPAGNRFVAAYEKNQGVPGFLVYELEELGPVRGSVDPARDEIRITAPLSAWNAGEGLGARPAYGARLVDFVADTRTRWVDVEGTHPGTTSDWAHSDGTVHVVGRAGCTR